MKKTVSLLLIVSVLLAFGVYAAADNNGITTISDEPETASGEEVPEWDMSISPEITEDIRALFDRAMEKLMGVEYTPVAVLGVIDSTYCILCKAAVVYPGARPYNVLVYINEDGVQNIYELWIEKHAEKEEPADGTFNCA